jgi:hypothetical protein
MVWSREDPRDSSDAVPRGFPLQSPALVCGPRPCRHNSIFVFCSPTLSGHCRFASALLYDLEPKAKYKVSQDLLLRGSKSLQLRERTMQPSRPSHQFVHAFSGGNPAFGESFLRSSHPRGTCSLHGGIANGFGEVNLCQSKSQSLVSPSS